MTKQKLHIGLLFACLAGYSWLGLGGGVSLAESQVTVCHIKNLTGIPCPSCGSTRAIHALLDGHFLQSLYWNPFGLVLASILLISPLWLLTDRITKGDSLFRVYQSAEKALKDWKIWLPMVLAILANWLWNILKGL